MIMGKLQNTIKFDALSNAYKTIKESYTLL